MEDKIREIIKKALENEFCETMLEELDGCIFVDDEDTGKSYMVDINEIN